MRNVDSQVQYCECSNIELITGGGGGDVDVAQAIPLIKNGLQGEGFNRYALWNVPLLTRQSNHHFSLHVQIPVPEMIPMLRLTIVPQMV